MAIEYKLPYTGEEVGRRLAQVDVLAQDIVDLGEAVEEQLTGLSDGFTVVIQQMYGEDFPENEGDPTTIREIAESVAPTKVSELTNDSGFITGYTETDPTVPAWAKAEKKPTYTASEVGAVPTSRTVNGKALSANISLSAADVGALPSTTTIPTVNNGTLTIQKNGTTVKTFTANSSSNVTANITVPTKVSELTNDKGYITEAPDEIYVGDGNMPADATIQIILDGSDEEEALKDDLKEYIDYEIAKLAANGLIITQSGTTLTFVNGGDE